jgi:hypothetical protein
MLHGADSGRDAVGNVVNVPDAACDAAIMPNRAKLRSRLGVMMFMLTSLIQIDDNLLLSNARNVPGWSGSPGVRPVRPQALPGLGSLVNQPVASMRWW